MTLTNLQKTVEKRGRNPSIFLRIHKNSQVFSKGCVVASTPLGFMCEPKMATDLVAIYLLNEPYVSPMYFLCISYTFPMHFLCIPYVFPMYSLCNSYAPGCPNLMRAKKTLAFRARNLGNSQTEQNSLPRRGPKPSKRKGGGGCSLTLYTIGATLEPPWVAVRVGEGWVAG